MLNIAAHGRGYVRKWPRYSNGQTIRTGGLGLLRSGAILPGKLIEKETSTGPTRLLDHQRLRI
jgi:hypothetical protein